MILDTIITKVGNSLYCLIPADVKRLYEIGNGTKGIIKIEENKIIIVFELKEKGVKND